MAAIIMQCVWTPYFVNLLRPALFYILDVLAIWIGMCQHAVHFRPFYFILSFLVSQTYFFLILFKLNIKSNSKSPTN